MKFIEKITNIFKYEPNNPLNFQIDMNSNNLSPKEDDEKNIFPSLDVNLDYIKTKYNTLINSDIVIREFKIPIKNINFSAFLLYIDGMVDNDSINDFILEPLLLKNSISMKPTPITHSSEDKRCLYKKSKKI